MRGGARTGVPPRRRRRLDPIPEGHHTVTPYLFVPDADAVYAKAIAAGATSLREPETLFYGHRSAGVEDPSGTQWWISTQVEELTAEEIERRMREAAGT